MASSKSWTIILFTENCTLGLNKGKFEVLGDREDEGLVGGVHHILSEILIPGKKCISTKDLPMLTLDYSQSMRNIVTNGMKLGSTELMLLGRKKQFYVLDLFLFGEK